MKEVFTVMLDGKDTELAVVRPTAEVLRKAQMYYNKIFGESLESGALLKDSLSKYMRKQNLWDDDKQQKYDEFNKILEDGEKSLNKGGVKLSEARKIAIQMRIARMQTRNLMSNVVDLQVNTAEGQAENAKFNYLVSACLVYNTKGTAYFKDIDDYLNRSDEPAAILGANKFANIYYGVADNHDAILPENQFLTKFKFIDEKLRLVNTDGKLCDADGRLVDEYGYYIDDNGHRIDIEGNSLDESGNYKFETAPFLDDDGKPIVEEGIKTDKEEVNTIAVEELKTE